MKSDKSHIFNRVKIDDLFELTLRPLQSSSARLIFKILYDSKEEYLTTLDMQNILKSYENSLSKKELNNWLTSLEDVNLVEKLEERGKPTTLPYNRRYTFDLWKLTDKGSKTGENLMIFLGNYPIPHKEKASSSTRFPDLRDLTEDEYITVEHLFVNYNLLTALKGYEGKVSLFKLSEIIGLSACYLEKFISIKTVSNKEHYYEFFKPKHGIVDRIKYLFRVKKARSIKVGLSPEGKVIASKIGVK